MQQIRTKYFMNRPITSCDRNGANIPPKSAQNAPKLRRTIRRGNRNREPNPLTGLLYCGECGAKMYNERSDGDAYHKAPKDNYVCASYRKRSREAAYRMCCAVNRGTVQSIRADGRYFTNPSTIDFFRLILSPFSPKITANSARSQSVYSFI